MPVSSCKSYLVTQVMAATPQRLQRMLVEAAIRFIERARRRWRAGEDESAIKATIRAQQIVGEMLGSLDHELASTPAKKAA